MPKISERAARKWAERYPEGPTVDETAGLRRLSIAQTSGTLVAVYNAAEAEMDDEAGAWVVMCETHGLCVNVDTFKTAVYFMPSPESFCECCAMRDSGGCGNPSCEHCHTIGVDVCPTCHAFVKPGETCTNGCEWTAPTSAATQTLTMTFEIPADVDVVALVSEIRSALAWNQTKMPHLAAMNAQCEIDEPAR